jgi:hypothetical protein
MDEKCKPSQLTESELWKFRAHLSERKALMAEITVLKMKLENLNIELEGFHNSLIRKYECLEFDGDGNITYTKEE